MVFLLYWLTVLFTGDKLNVDRMFVVSAVTVKPVRRKFINDGVELYVFIVMLADYLNDAGFRIPLRLRVTYITVCAAELKQFRICIVCPFWLKEHVVISNEALSKETDSETGVIVDGNYI